MSSIDYNEDMKIHYYNDGSLEIVEIKRETSWIHYYISFKDKNEFLALLKSNPKLLKELKELI